MNENPSLNDDDDDDDDDDDCIVEKHQLYTCQQVG